ncbi:MAG: DUF2258 domain-containing protein [Acidilobus sp.]
MPRLSSGLIIVGAYALKVRRTLFAQLRDRTRADREWAQKVAYGAAQLNRVLFEILVNRLKLDKGDVVRVRIDYDVDDARKEISWRWDTLTVEVFRRVPEDQLTPAVKEVASKAAEIAVTGLRYEAARLGETEDGDVIFTMRAGGRDVGAVIITPLNDEVLLKTGAVLEPSPVILGRSRLKVAGRQVEEVVADYVSKSALTGRQVEEQEALKVINDLRARASARPFEEEEGEGEAG